MTLVDAIRKAAGSDAWSSGSALARQGRVLVEAVSAQEVRCGVRIPGRALPFQVFLWPEEEDWDCDCSSRAAACAHVAASVIAWTGPEAAANPVAGPAPSRLRVRHVLSRDGQGLGIRLALVRPDGPSDQPVAWLRGSLATSQAWVSAGDLEVEAALATVVGSRISREVWRRVLAGLADAADVTLDGEAVQVSRTAISGVVRVEDDGDGFRVRLVRDPRIQEVFDCGVVRCGMMLHPVRPSALQDTFRTRLQVGIHYDPDDVGRLVSEVLPSLGDLHPLDVRTSRLPDPVRSRPLLALKLARTDEHHLEILPSIVYGQPATARVDGDRLTLLGGTVPVRDRVEEEARRRECSALLGTAPGRSTTLPPAEAIRFVRDRLSRFKGLVEGSEVAQTYRIVDRPFHLGVHIDDHGRDGFRVRFETGTLPIESLLGAWSRGESLVPLSDGGFAPLPAGWLAQHGWALAEVFTCRDEQGVVPLHVAPVLASLQEALDAPRTPNLDRLRALFQGFQGLPATSPPANFQGRLRSYQQRGVDWLAFLRSAGLGGVLADDMGLGKTVQALAALGQVEGPHLVVAPTTVARNWVLEAERFLPGSKVCFYHGAERRLDPGADLVVTSYALLRRDIDALVEIEWASAVLDEAQAIKNPESLVAQAARRIRARHRFALTGTPVENRLEELWSIFAFLIPGFLGSRREFGQRLQREGGRGADGERPDLAGLRRRLRPFVLRRNKRDVAPELPPRTEVVLRCELGEDQRAVYETLRAASRGRALEDLRAGRMLGALEALLRLRQVACHPALLPGNPGMPSAKLDLLVEHLQGLADAGHRALVFSQWTSMLDLVEPALADAGLAWCRLDGSTRDRQAVVDRFQGADGPPVFLLSLKAGGTGLNLTAADYVFHLDPWWNPAVEAQATDRAHRIGQTRPVVSCRLIAAGTVEERILLLQESKRHLASAVVGDEESLSTALSRDDLAALFD